jgi:multifunctional methyltransferase subunit TRM112
MKLDFRVLKHIPDIFMLQLGFPQLPEQAPTAVELKGDDKTLRDLHHLLLETQMSEGKLVCGSCGHEYAVKEGIANFLLPSHLV